MSTNDPTADKGRHEDGKLADLPGAWRSAAPQDDAFLVHESGARLVIKRAAPTQRPRSEAERRARPWELDFEPPDRPVLQVVDREGSRDAQRDRALEFARTWPDAQPDESALSLHQTGWSE